MTSETYSKSSPSAFSIKGDNFRLTTIELYTADSQAIKEHFQYLSHKAPLFFQNSPIVVSLEKLNNPEKLDFLTLRQTMEDHGMVLVAIQSNAQHLKKNFPLTAIAWLPPTQNKFGKKNSRNELFEPIKNKETVINEHKVHYTFGRVVQGPIRSGQQVYSENDLTIIGSVSEGSEILAKGHIHVYGSLRGRALAGINGCSDARIFCRQLQAELIAIGGKYQLSADINKDFIGKNVNIYLQNQDLHIAEL